MKCPFCGFENDKVVDSRESKEGESIRRRRECLKCEKRFTTYERIDEIPYMVVKKDGRREKFERQKVLTGLLRACEKRPVSMGKLEQIVNDAEGFVVDSPDRERKTSEIGELIMNRLRRIDKVAYVRFASVYLDFKDVREFMEELKELLDTKENIDRKGQVRRLSPAANNKDIMAHKVTLIPGDGIGPEVVKASVRILEATGVKFEWESFAAGAEAYEKYKEYIPKELIESIERTVFGLKGPVTTPIGGGFSSINVALRKQFELFANFRPIRNLPSVPTRYPGVDLVIVRENTEGLYSGIEHEVVPGVVESLKIITEKASTRISRFAFEYARKHQSQEDPRHPQSQHHEAVGWPVHSLLAQHLEGVSRDHLRRAHCRQHLHAAGDEPLPVRHAAAGESLRRHHLRPVRRVRRRTWDWCRARTSATSARSSRRSTAPRPTLPAKTSPIRQRCCVREF